MEIRRVALIGAGAVGCYILWGFEETEGVTFSVIARGERLNRLRKNGLMINGERHTVSALTPEEAGEQDLILLATKHNSLSEALELLPPMVGQNTLVMSLLNGMDSEGQIAALIGERHVIPAMMWVASRRTADGVFFDPAIARGITFGLPARRKAEQEKTDAILSLLSRTRLHYRLSQNIMTDIWYKYACNVANNLPQAVLGVPATLYGRSAHGHFLAQQLWTEVAAVAATQGVTLQPEVQIFPGAELGPRYSTLQDLDAGRETEIEMFAGQLMALAEKVGIAVPYITYTYHAIRALEEKNRGLFS